MSVFHTDIDFDSKLIDLVRANPILYEKDLRTTPYMDMKKKFELWSHIATSLNRDTKYCILRWKSLRAKYRREMVKLGKESDWVLFDEMKFIERHIRYQSTQRNLKSPEHQTVPVNYSNMDAEQLIEEVLDDDPLQEAMDEQNSTFTPFKDKTINSPPASMDANKPSTSSQYIGTMKRIEALLEGLGDHNRSKAEKRIVAYLCKCQLKSLNNEDVDDIDI
ncbi:uncharacterized protein LOC119600744 [Lucilia sericata]|uniref:uncharacterized protein LOC119600744 n=1 Tax=Lucilia sericata TaxID=13632 RepID=UPI0018A7E8A8|nr:uncharacterized protein LOC119600744 [Lucilia sericata]